MGPLTYLTQYGSLEKQVLTPALGQQTTLIQDLRPNFILNV